MREGQSMWQARPAPSEADSGGRPDPLNSCCKSRRRLTSTSLSCRVATKHLIELDLNLDAAGTLRLHPEPEMAKRTPKGPERPERRLWAISGFGCRRSVPAASRLRSDSMTSSLTSISMQQERSVCTQNPELPKSAFRVFRALWVPFWPFRVLGADGAFLLHQD